MANNHSPFFDLAKAKYESGAWSKSAIRVLVEKGKMTASEYREITGEEYT